MKVLHSDNFKFIVRTLNLASEQLKSLRSIIKELQKECLNMTKVWHR